MLRLITLFLLVSALRAVAAHTFTDQMGRTISADLISVHSEQVTIRRTDGQLFTLAISTFTKEDQKYVHDWASTQSDPSTPKPDADEKPVIDPKKITIGLSRGKFDSHTLAKYDGYTHKHEDWGYTIQIRNTNLHPVKSIRVEYNLFARTFSDISTPSMVSGTKTIDVLKTGGTESFRTRTAEICKRQDIYFGNDNGELRGIWIKLYVDNQLISEQSSPETLLTKEKWSKPEAD